MSTDSQARAMSPPENAMQKAMEVERQIAVHVAECVQRQARIEEKLDAIHDDQKEQSTRLRTIEDKMTEAKGGWKVIAAAGAVGAAMMAAVVKLLPYLGGMLR